MARYLDMGNITAQLELKNRLNCKSFAWFMKDVAYDVLEKYPELPPNVHWGEASFVVIFITLLLLIIIFPIAPKFGCQAMLGYYGSRPP